MKLERSTNKGRLSTSNRLLLALGLVAARQPGLGWHNKCSEYSVNTPKHLGGGGRGDKNRWLVPTDRFRVA